MNAPSVQRRREKRALFPFEGLLRSVFVPDGGLAFAIEHEDRFFEHEPDRLSTDAGHDLKKISPISCFRALEVEQSCIRSESFPGFHFDGSHVRNVIAAMNG